MKQKPLTIENRWEILYSDFPEVYDEFASVPKDPPLLQALIKRVDFHGKVAADIGLDVGVDGMIGDLGANGIDAGGDGGGDAGGYGGDGGGHDGGY